MKNRVSRADWLDFWLGDHCPGQPKRRPLRGRLLQYSIDIRDNYARLRRENAP